MIDYILARLSEPSTWRGIIWIATAFGLALSPDQQEAIASFGLTLVGLISVFVERGNAHSDEEKFNMYMFLFLWNDLLDQSFHK
jgi:hypothetical protein